jgi:hypothetical protein
MAIELSNLTFTDRMILSPSGVEEILNTGIANTLAGNDIIIGVFLENGKDYLKGFGRGIFNGGNGKDTLELTPGSYTYRNIGNSGEFHQG